MIASTPASTLSRTRTRDGSALTYTMLGRDDGRPRFALVHSLAMDHRFWQPVAELLARDAAVLVYDCRGHGGSDKPPGPYSVEQFADDLADLLDHVGWPRAIVAGASMGGCITLAFAAAYPARAAAIGLIDTTAWYGAAAPKAWEERAERALTEGLGSLVAFQTTRWFTDAFHAAHPEIVQQSIDVFLTNDIPAYAATCRMLGAANLTAALPGMRMPAAVVVGEEDYATPVAMAEALHRAIRGSTLTVLNNGRHLTPLELPDRVAAELIRLTEVTPAS